MDKPPQEAPALDARVRDILTGGALDAAVTELLRSLGPQVFGFLRGALGNEFDADEAFAATSERVWKSLPKFQWKSSLRTWMYVIAHRELARYVEGARRHVKGRVTPSALEEVIGTVRTETRSALKTEKKNKARALRDELPVADRALLILRVDRGLPWAEVARAFLPEEEQATHETLQRESARLRKRFELVWKHLAKRAREEGILPK